MKDELIGVFSRSVATKGKIYVYRDERSGQAVVRFMLHKKRQKKHLLTMPLAEFQRLSAAVLARLGCAPEGLESENGRRT